MRSYEKLNCKRTKLSFDYSTKGRAPCGSSVLASFGIKNQPLGSTYTYDVLLKLRSAGYYYRTVIRDGDPTISLYQFMKSHKTGSYVLHCRGHLMSLINGRLTDTALYGGNKRQILEAFKLVKR